MQNAWRFIDDEILREPATRKPIRQRTWHRGRLPTRRRRRSRCPSSRWATANLTVAKRILAATDKSIAWLADPSHRDEAIELLVKVARSSKEDAEASYDYLRRIEYFEPSSKVSRMKLRNLVAMEQRAGTVNPAFAIDRLVMPGLTELTD